MLGLDPPVPSRLHLAHALEKEATLEIDLRARARRQAVLAQLGLMALETTDLQALLDEAVERIRETLEIDTCSVLELMPGGQTLMTRADCGWSERLAGKHTVDAGRRSQAGYTLLSSEPVIVEDVSKETRFTIAPMLIQSGIKSGMTVIIHGREQPFGVFGVQSKRLRTFTKEDVDYFQATANVLASAIDRLSTEEELRRSEESFRNLIEHAPEGILISEDRIIYYVNRALVSYLGYESASDLLGKSAYEIVHPEDRGTVAGRLRGMDDTRVPAAPREMRFLRRDGTPVLAESIGVPIVFNGKQAIAALIRDITERRRIESQLQLGDRLSSLGTLAAGVAHEINNPLTYVLGNLDFMRAHVAEMRASWASLAAGAGPQARAQTIEVRLDDLATLIEGARDGGERIRQIVSDLKSFSRAQSEDQPVPVDVRKVMDSSLSMTKNEIRHRARLVKEYLDVPPVMANESRLGQVFLNLLVNAAQAIPDGAAQHHRIHVRTLNDPSGRVVVEVRDTGSGISKEDQSRLFDPFFTTKPVGVGTGLGLSICHNIVTGYSGEIAVESEPGKGSCFRVTLPAAKVNPAPAPLPSGGAAPSRRGRVLIIDDEPFVAGVIQRMLSAHHDVDVVTAAATAIARIESGQEYDVILCDLMMPEMSGMDFYDHLAERRPDLAARIVFLSGGAFSAHARAFRERVPSLFLDKPCSPALLRATVSERVGSLRR
jgi:PAS domain S-box-containing protein